MKKFLGIVGLVILLSACASTNTNYYTSSVQSWKGENVRALIARWGKPDYRVAVTNGHSLLSYHLQSYSAYIPPTSPEIGVNTRGGRPVIVTEPTTNNTWNRGALSLTCNVLIEIDERGTIVRTKVVGNSCYGGTNFAEKYAKPAG